MLLREVKTRTIEFPLRNRNAGVRTPLCAHFSDTF